MPPFIDLTGQKFGKLKVIRRVGNDRWKNPRWLCGCDCKKEIIVLGGALRSGHTKSCGCLHNEQLSIMSTTHGYTKTKEKSKIYYIWISMKQRCMNLHDKAYYNYGGRGIKVCKRWINSFPNFLEDMGEKPSANHSIHRKNNDKGYYKKNCEWATRKQQNRNSRNNHLITFNGKTQCMIEWSEETGIPASIISWRLIHDWSIEKALTTPVRKRRKKK